MKEHSALLVTALVAILVSAVVYAKSNTVIDLQKKQIRLLQQKVDFLQTSLDGYESMPDYLTDSWLKCNTPEVPEAFRKDCLCFEIKRSKL